MERTIRTCDRCHAEANPPGCSRVTLHAHHDRTIDLCKLCRDTLTVWLAVFDDGVPVFSREHEQAILGNLAVQPTFGKQRP